MPAPLALYLSRDALKFLDTLPPKQFRQVVQKVLALLREPHPPDSKLLKGAPYHRADAGEYRIIYEARGDALRVFAIGKRNDGEVYRHLG